MKSFFSKFSFPMILLVMLWPVLSFATPAHNTFTPFVNVADVFLAPVLGSSVAYGNIQMSSNTLVAASTTFLLAHADYTDVINPRNIVCQFALKYATATANVEVDGASLIIVGYNARGTATTEILSVSTTAATGNVAWSSVTSYTLIVTTITGMTAIDNAQGTVQVQIGSGNKLGLSNALDSTADIIKVIENGTLSTTYTVSAPYDTITFASSPNGSQNYKVIYGSKGK